MHACPVSRTKSNLPLAEWPSTKRLPRARRSGLTLLEILLASVILAAALAALAQQNASGVRASLRAKLETEAALRCQSQLNRLLVTGIDSASVAESPLPGDAPWMWSASTEPSSADNLMILTVRVFRADKYRTLSEFQLSRLVPFSGEFP